MLRSFFLFLLFSLLVNTSKALLRNPIIKSIVSTSQKVSNTKLYDTTATAIESFSFVTSFLQKVSSDQARTEFYFFFFGGSGALGIGAAQIPKILKEYASIKLLSGSKSEGGEDLDLSPLVTLGYPEAVKVNDAQKIIDSLPPASKILELGPKRTFMAKSGYMEVEGFYNALPECNKLALYTAFTAFSSGGYGSPAQYNEFVDNLKSGGIDSFKTSVLAASAKKLSAYAVFGFLIALVLDLIIESAAQAFF